MSSLIDKINHSKRTTLYEHLSEHPNAGVFGIVDQQKQEQRQNRAAAARKPYRVEIVKDHDGSYYANVTINGKMVGGLPEYVPYRKLKAAIKENCGIELPSLSTLDFHCIGRKKYAYWEGELNP